MKHVKLFIAAFLLAATIAIIGCGGSTADTVPTTTNGIPVISDEAKNLDPCSLLSKDDVKAIAGQDFKDPVRKGTSCNYDSVGVQKFQSLLVIAQPGTDNDFTYQQKALSSTTAAPVEVSDVGDKAVFLNDNEIMVLKKDVLITMTGFGIDKDHLKQLAQKAAEKV